MDLRALWKLSYGVYVVSSEWNGKINGQIVNTAFQITAEPPTFAVSINKENYTHELIKNSKKFGISVLRIDTPMKLIGTFGFRSGREIDKFKDVKYRIGKTGVPLLEEYCVAHLECQVFKEVDMNTHTLFIGNLVNAELLEDAEPLTYADYHLVKKGKTPKRATTYISEDKLKKV